MKIRNMFAAVLALSMVSVAAMAQQRGTGASGGTAGDLPCFCFTDETGAGVCLKDEFCDEVQACGPGSPCPAGFVCAINQCCGTAHCFLECPTPGNCPDGAVCGETFLACEAAPVPTVSEWGLVVLTLIGCIAGSILFAAARRRVQPTA